MDKRLREPALGLAPWPGVLFPRLVEDMPNFEVLRELDSLLQETGPPRALLVCGVLEVPRVPSLVLRPFV